MLMERRRSHLLVIDVQERLVPAITASQPLLEDITRLLFYAARLDVPVSLTEHMPDRIGSFLPALRKIAPTPAPCLAKSSFSAWHQHEFAERLNRSRRAGRDQLIVAGMEAHVCVMQTALDLIAQNFEVFLVRDAIGSRTVANRDAAVERLRAAGAHIVTHEMVAFEWLERGDAPEFKDVLSVLK